MADDTDLRHMARALGWEALILPYPGAPLGLSIDERSGQWEVRTAAGGHHSFLGAEVTLQAALEHVYDLGLRRDTDGLPEPAAGTRIDQPAEVVGAPAAVLDLQTVGRVCWTHPVYDGLHETWRPRARIETSYQTIAAFLTAKESEGWEAEPFEELATSDSGQQFPVVAVSLTRTMLGGAPQDDLIHVWVEPGEPKNAA